MQSERDTPPKGPLSSQPTSRRGFLLGLLTGSGGSLAVVASFAGWRFLSPDDMAPEAAHWQRIGVPTNFSVGETLASTLSVSGGSLLIWVRHQPEGQFTAFSSRCTHLGSTVDWRPEREQFICRVHGGRFDANGDVAAGPVPRAMDRHPVRIWNGFVEVHQRPVDATGRAGCVLCRHA